MSFELAPYREQFEAAYQDVSGLHMLRFVWKNLLAMFESQPELPAHELVNYWLATSYSRTIAVGIRRQCEASGTRPTIGSLLRRVKAHAAEITRTTCEFDTVSTWSDGRDGWLLLAGGLDQPLDGSRVEPLIAQLTSASATANRWVNKRVAHYDATLAVEGPTFDDLDAALEQLREAVVFLYRLLNRGDLLLQVTPDFTANWMESFRHPWYDPQRMQMIEARDLG